MQSEYEILDEAGNVMNVIVADETFCEEVHPGRWRPVPVEAGPDPVPTAVTNFQARAAFMAADLFEQVDGAVRAQGGAAFQAWEYANEFTRTGALVTGLAALGITDAQLDDLFRAAARIEA